MKWEYRAAAGSDPGRERKENQDCFVCNETLGLFAVSDGMGGLAYGKETAQEVIRLLETFFSFEKRSGLSREEITDLMSKMILAINTQVIEMGNEENRTPLYGATLTGFLIYENYAVIFNVGDSRVYCLRKEPPMMQLTTDDSLLQSILKANVTLSEEEMRNAGSILLEYMGLCPRVEPKVQVVELQEEDVLCACSDGLSGMLTDQEIEGILKQNIPVEDKVNQLIQRANEAGGEDNITVLVWQKGKERRE